MISSVSHVNPQMAHGIPKTTSSTTFLSDLNLHQNLASYASEESAFSEDSASEPTTSDNSDSSDYEYVDVDADDDVEDRTVRSAPPLVGIGITAPRPRTLHRSDSDESGASSDEDYLAIEAEQGDDFDDQPVRSVHWAPSTTQRSVASRRLFAVLSREDGGNATKNTSNDLCSRRGHRRLPSLDQIRTRVSGLGIRDTNPSPKLHGSPAPRILVQPSPTPSPRTPTARSRLTSGSAQQHKRSVSCPSPKPEQVWQVNEDMTITVTPPTPTPQARSPIMGYILQNAGHPVHPVRFRRHRDDVDLLQPPCFELAPGRQQMVEARARQAMEQMAALHAVAKDQHRVMGPGNGALVGLGWPAGSPAPVGTGLPPQSAPAPLSSRPIRATIRGGGGGIPVRGPRRERGIAANMPKSQSLSSLSDDWRQRATTTVPLPPRAASPPRVAAVAKYIPPCRRQGPAYQPPSPPAGSANKSFNLPARPASPPSSAPPATSQSARAVAGRHLLSRLSERGGRV